MFGVGRSMFDVHLFKHISAYGEKPRPPGFFIITPKDCDPDRTRL
jgi:hypothetical protein